METHFKFNSSALAYTCMRPFLPRFSVLTQVTIGSLLVSLRFRIAKLHAAQNHSSATGVAND